MRRAFSLVEILIVIAVVVLLAGITFPIIQSSRREGERGRATAHLRQVSAATLLYREDSGMLPPTSLDPLVDGGYLKDPRLLRVFGDTLPDGYGGERVHCLRGGDARVRYPSSVETTYAGATAEWVYRNTLLPHDQQAGILAVRTLGDRSDIPLRECAALSFLYEGLVLRARLDGSVSRSRMKIRRFQNRDGTTYAHACNLSVFTDADEVCNWSQGPG